MNIHLIMNGYELRRDMVFTDPVSAVVKALDKDNSIADDRVQYNLDELTAHVFEYNKEYDREDSSERVLASWVECIQNDVDALYDLRFHVEIPEIGVKPKKLGGESNG